ncbi:MAG TPA: hypothetical protein VEW03_06625 [Longimicrobiaceae bacterium]|nr:hypothetical protein [Longimicrobiaceae bacterium]
MRKMLILTAALALWTVPAVAQQKTDAPPEAPAAAMVAAPAPAQASAPEAERSAPSLHVSTDEVRRQVQAIEGQRSVGQQMNNQSWLYLVAAIVVGVVIAWVILE